MGFQLVQILMTLNDLRWH